MLSMNQEDAKKLLNKGWRRVYTEMKQRQRFDHQTNWVTEDGKHIETWSKYHAGACLGYVELEYSKGWKRVKKVTVKI